MAWPRVETPPRDGAIRIGSEAPVTLLDGAAAVVLVDEGATILWANDAWADYTRARGGSLGPGDDYLAAFRREAADGGPDALIPAGICEVLRGDSPAFRSEYPHAAGGRRWLIGLDCRPLPGFAPSAFVCRHEHVASAPAGDVPGAFEVPLEDVGDGLRRLEAVLRTMGSGHGARALPGEVAAILADVGARAASGREASIRRRLAGERGVAEVNVHIALGPFGGAPVARGTIVAPPPPPSASASASPATDHAAAVVQGMSEGVFTMDDEGLIRFVNAAAEDMLGWSGADLVGRQASRTIARRMGGRRGRPRPSRIDRARAKGAVVRVHDDVFMRRDGAELSVAYTVTPLPGPGGGAVVVFSDAGERSAGGGRRHGERAHVAIVARVRQALAHDDFVLFAQPVYDLRSMDVHTHELLIRMREPNGHLRPPAQFLPVAERSGLIVEIDEWVIRQAAGLAARGHDVSLNVSAASVGTPGFVETVAEMLDEAGADPRRVIMELTETAVVRDERPARAFIDAMRALGCEFALDDFGTGYGGFTYIKHLAIDYLKIDREFVRDLDRDISSRHVVEVIVSLASRFGLRTVAEGVESRACLDVLADLGVDYAQGYRLMRPGPLDRVFAEGA